MPVPAGPSLGVAQRALLALITVYRWTLSGLLGGHCRFHPSCSRYALEAVRSHGALRGGWLSAGRLLRCHPWSPGGIDAVPEAPGRGVDGSRGEAGETVRSTEARSALREWRPEKMGSCGGPASRAPLQGKHPRGAAESQRMQRESEDVDDVGFGSVRRMGASMGKSSTGPSAGQRRPS